jgi:diacylglycerol kinase (ATP)
VPLLRSFRFASEGLSHLWTTQRNFRIEVGIGLVALAIGLLVHLERWEWVALLLTIALVLVLEALNTTLENAVTLASPNVHPQAKAAKDVAAAAVLIAAIVSIAIGILIFGPRLGLWG